MILPADSIEKILNLNHDPAQSTDGHTDPNASNGLTSSSAPILNSDGDPIWKVLVFDDLGRDVISSVLRVNDLRMWGVTMHMYVERTIFNLAFT
jgi:sec1 family domain-containing protein 1